MTKSDKISLSVLIVAALVLGMVFGYALYPMIHNVQVLDLNCSLPPR